MSVTEVIPEAPGRFDFGLSSEQEARAERLHRESIIFDFVSEHAGGNIFAHYPEDLQAEFNRELAAKRAGSPEAIDPTYWPYEMSKLGKSDLLREWYKISGLTCGQFSIHVHDGRDPGQIARENVVLRYASLPWLRYVTTAAEVRQAKRDGIVAFYGNCQQISVPLNLNAFDAAYAKGLRSFMLTYNQMNALGVGCTERVDAGLSRYGLAVVKHCNDIGMMVDVSHCGHSTTMDACRYSKKPVNANHTTARSVYVHDRSKNNEALRAIAATGGVIGVLTVPFFLSGEASPTVEHMLDHIDYIADLVGWQHVAIGTDWPMQEPDAWLQETLGSVFTTVLGFREGDHIDVTKRLVGFDDCRDWPNITRGLVKRGYSDEQIRGILGENALRVFAEVCG